MIRKIGKKEINIACNAYDNGMPVVIPTDTIYGITSRALDKRAIAKLYRLRKRDSEKPFIILISSIKDLATFGIDIDNEKKRWLRKVWPNKLTVVFPCNDKNFRYLYRDKKSLAFRMPKDRWLSRLISRVGPIVAPSANLQGCDPAKNISEAIGYFGDKAFYIDRGTIKGKPSTIVSFENDFTIIRKGSFKLKKDEYFRSSIDN